jgi:hypothetical protein
VTRAARWLLALAAAAPAAAAAQCEAPGARLESERLVVVYRTLPEKVVVGQHFAVEARVCAKGAGAAPTALRVDADMPAHRHGMNYRAKVAAKGDGRYVAEGLLFHMPGQWRLLFDVEAGGRRERLAADLTLE